MSGHAYLVCLQRYTRHPHDNRLDMVKSLNRPHERLAQYELLLKGIMEASPEGHEDHEGILRVIEVINSLLEETERGVMSVNRTVELWRYTSI
jgi:RHO1 GDP-GTP exchange protein 1/2